VIAQAGADANSLNRTTIDNRLRISRRKTTDYSPTLSKMEQALQVVGGRLEAVERQPTRTFTPAGLRAEIDAVACSAVSVASRPFICGEPQSLHSSRCGQRATRPPVEFSRA